ncbi:MAG: DNA repair protein RadC [Clostridia bacterium]|nr:DNA repair protein RadC [Clostridia bacterium]
MAKSIIELPYDDRPYEKLELVGANHLTNSELLAIVIKTGTSRYNCVEIAQNILTVSSDTESQNDLEYFMNLSMEELKSFEGIGRVKAIQIKAVIELARRIANTHTLEKKKIISPKDVYNLLGKKYLGEKQEILKTVILNKQNAILSIVTNAKGSIDKVEIGMKEVFSEPIKQLASGIILVHNHPSGSLVPSKSDIEFTNKVCEYSKIFGIELLDHIIIGNNSYMSLKEQKKF